MSSSTFSISFCWYVFCLNHSEPLLIPPWMYSISWDPILTLQVLLGAKISTIQNYCQARVPGLTYWMVKHLREKLKSHRESQKGTRADAIIQIHPPTTHHNNFWNSIEVSNLNLKTQKGTRADAIIQLHPPLPTHP